MALNTEVDRQAYGYDGTEFQRTFKVVFVFTCFTSVSAKDLSNWMRCSSWLTTLFTDTEMREIYTPA